MLTIYLNIKRSILKISKLLLIKSAKAAGLLVISGVFLSASHADTYPSKPITMVVPFGSGSATDILARVVGESLSKTLDTPVVIENKAGALGTIGTGQVARAKPDGYTLLVGTNTTNAAINAFMKSVPYDPQKDFLPISFLGELTQVAVVGNDSPFQSLEELLNYAKEHPGELSYAWSNTVTRIASAMLAQQAELDFLDIPYKEATNALVDVISGRVDFAIDNVLSIDAQVKNGNLRPLAVSSKEELPSYPGVPTISDVADLDDYEVKAFFALFAPAGTPKEIIDTLSKATQQAGKDPQVQKRLTTLGMEVVTSEPEELGARVDQEIKSWTESAKKAGIEPM